MTLDVRYIFVSVVFNLFAMTMTKKKSFFLVTIKARWLHVHTNENLKRTDLKNICI